MLLTVCCFTRSPFVCLGFLRVLQLPKPAGKLIHYDRLPLGVNDCVDVCVCCPVMDWHPTRGVFSHLVPSALGIDSEPSATLTRIKRLLR